MVSNSSESLRPKLRPVRLTDQIVAIIREQMFSAALRPGDRVVEQKLARELGVGQNAIREALISMAHTGFVRRVPNKGTYVTEITEQDGSKIARVRKALEGLVVDLVVERAAHEPIDYSVLEERVQRMRELLRAGDIAAFYECDIEFHRKLWSLASNEYLSQLLEQIVVPLFAFFIMVNRDVANQFQDMMAATEMHQAIADGLKKGSASQAHAAVNMLLETSQHFSTRRGPVLAKKTEATRRGGG
jgi:DNA-binding GntR family transcriptional regulator